MNPAVNVDVEYPDFSGYRRCVKLRPLGTIAQEIERHNAALRRWRAELNVRIYAARRRALLLRARGLL